MCPAAVTRLWSPDANVAPDAPIKCCNHFFSNSRRGKWTLLECLRTCWPSCVFHRLKDNDAALEQRHSATHRLNEERRRDEPSSFISGGRGDKTEKKMLSLSNYFSEAAVMAVLPALLKRSAAALWWFAITVEFFTPLLSFTGRRGSEALGRSNTKPGPGDEASLRAPVNHWQKTSCGRLETFPKVCLAKMSIREC